MTRACSRPRSRVRGLRSCRVGVREGGQVAGKARIECKGGRCGWREAAGLENDADAAELCARHWHVSGAAHWC
jgi:hypothetical protein